MPQLTHPLSNERGSVLVAALAFAIIMGIAGSGLLMLSGHSANMEDAAYKNDLAFQAFETGLQLGKRWLADTATYNNLIAGNTLPPFTDSINGMQLSVTLKSDTVISRVTGPGLDVAKFDTCMASKSSAAWPGVFINNPDPLNPGGLNNIWFDGPFHSNAPLVLATASNAYFVNGTVTVHDRTTNGGYGTLPSGNNYDFGIQGDNLDAHFQNTFTHSQDSLYFPGLIGQTILLPSNLSLSPARRAILYFDTASGIGTATYYYFNNFDVLQTPVPIANINNQIIRAQNHISVLGIVKGKVTVVTNTGSNIYVVGNLVYSDFPASTLDPNNTYFSTYDNTTNYGIGSDTSFIALVSGRYIRFLQGEEKDLNASTGTLVDRLPGVETTLYLTAALVATELGRGLRWDTDINGNILPIGSFNYKIRAIGSRAEDVFFDYTYINGAAANSKFRFYFDTRLSNPGLTAPGLPGFNRVTTAGNELFLLKSTWREQNN